MKKSITSKQQSILRFIEQSYRTRGFPPTLREIGAEFGIRSTYGVRYHLDALERAGHLERARGTRRGLRLAGSAARRSVPMPLLGQVAAGEPVLAVEQSSDGQIVVDQDLFSLDDSAEGFCLRVRGDSMIDAGIYAGDIAVVRKQETAASGDVVVALLNDEATVKRIELNGGLPVLHPANGAYASIRVAPEDRFQVLGRVVGILRALKT